MYVSMFHGWICSQQSSPVPKVITHIILLNTHLMRWNQQSPKQDHLSHTSPWNRHPGTMAFHLGLLHRRQSSRLMMSMCSIPRRRLRRPRCIPAITLAIVLAFCSSVLLILGCIPLVAARIIPTTRAGGEDGASRHNNNWAVLVRFCTRLLVIVLQAVIPQVLTIQQYTGSHHLSSSRV